MCRKGCAGKEQAAWRRGKIVFIICGLCGDKQNLE
jgi:hypothetical protein